MTKTRKVLTLAMAVCLLVAISIGATMAYLTATAGTVTNTFTVGGNIAISLDEAIAEYDSTTNVWKATEERTTTGQAYKLLPGTVVEKDPTVTVEKGSENCFVRAFVKITYLEEADTVVNISWLNLDNNTWIPENGEHPTTTKADGKITRTYELRYKDIVTAAETKDAPLALKDIFTTITVPSTLDGNAIKTLEGFEIAIDAEAIQSDGFADAAAAWTAYAGK